MEYIIDIDPNTKEERQKSRDKFWKKAQKTFDEILGPSFKRVIPKEDMPKVYEFIDIAAKQLSEIFK